MRGVAFCRDRKYYLPVIDVYVCGLHEKGFDTSGPLFFGTKWLIVISCGITSDDMFFCQLPSSSRRNTGYLAINVLSP